MRGGQNLNVLIVSSFTEVEFPPSINLLRKEYNPSKSACKIA